MLAKFIKINYKLSIFNKERAIWMIVSGFMIAFLITIAISWNTILETHNPKIWGAIGLTLVIVTVNWWYWTMGLVKRLLEFQKDEIVILQEIVDDIRTIKNDVQDLQK